jgi:hypothetical protein
MYFEINSDACCITVAMKKIRKKFFDGNKNTCAISCPSLISNGFGRWINGRWKSLSSQGTGLLHFMSIFGLTTGLYPRSDWRQSKTRKA